MYSKAAFGIVGRTVIRLAKLPPPPLKTHFNYLKYQSNNENRITQKKSYTVEEIWECSWKAASRIEKCAKIYSKIHNALQRLDPLDAFFGGRTNATKLKYKVERREKIRYIDVYSLYTTV